MILKDGLTSYMAAGFLQIDKPPTARISVVDFVGNLNLVQDPYLIGSYYYYALYNTDDEYIDINTDGHFDRKTHPVTKLPAFGDEHQFPVAYVRGSTVTLNGEFRITDGVIPAGPAGSIKVRARGGELETNEVIATPFNDGRWIRFNNAVSLDPLSNEVDFDPEFEIKWQVSFDGGQNWRDAGSSKQKLYQTLAAPINQNQDLFETVVYIGSKFGDGATSAAQLVPPVWAEFSDRSVQTVNAVTMRYWGTWVLREANTNKGSTTAELLAMADGRCVAWASLFSDVLAAQGIASEKKTLQAKPVPFATETVGIIIKNWNFDEAGVINIPNFGPVYPDTHVTRANTGIAGQANPNPHKIFKNHVLVEYGSKLYDPSYGGDPYADLPAWEVKALAGVTLIQVVNGQPRGYVARQSARQLTDFE